MNIPDIAAMTLREKIGQMFIMRDDRLHDMVPDAELADYLREHPIGGLWATGRLKKPATYLNFEAGSGGGTMDDLRDYVALLNNRLNIPLLVGGDSEKGEFMGTTAISGPDAAAAADDDELSYRYSACVAEELKTGGINWRWSPIADLCHHDSSVSVNRVCSDDPDRVIRLTRAMVRGSQDRGVAACVKHFPGQDLEETRDSHFMTSVNNASFEDWMRTQGRVYREAIESGVYSVMIGHHAFPALDDSRIGKKRRPATFSKKIITGLLKEQWGYNGVVFTDDIGMRAALSIYGRENMAALYVELIKAGNDMLLGTPIGMGHEDYIGAIEAAVQRGEIPEGRIDDACARVLAMKRKLGLFGSPAAVPDAAAAAAETHRMNRELAKRSLTLISNDGGLLPLRTDRIKRAAVITVTHSDDFLEKLVPLKDAFEHRGVSTVLYNGTEGYNLQHIAEENDLILYANFVSAHRPMGRCSFFGDVAQQFFKILSYGSEKSVVVSFGSPFLRKEYYEEAETYINAYWYNSEVMEALAEALFGDIPFTGRSPFRI